MKFNDFKVGMEVRVKDNASSLTGRDSYSRDQDCRFLKALQGKIGVILCCEYSDQTIKVKLDPNPHGDWFDACHLELVPTKVTLKSLQEEAVLRTEQAKAACAALDAFIAKSKTYSFNELTTIAPNGIYKCNDTGFVYSSRFVVSNKTIIQIDAGGSVRIPYYVNWSDDEFVQIDASYKVTITEVIQ